jgi:hypothetical protein
MNYNILFLAFLCLGLFSCDGKQPATKSDMSTLGVMLLFVAKKVFTETKDQTKNTATEDYQI